MWCINSPRSKFFMNKLWPLFKGRTDVRYASRTPGWFGTLGIYTEEYHNVLMDPRIKWVYICTPTHRHFDDVEHALSYGKNVLVEKTPATNWKDLQALKSLAYRCNTKLEVASQAFHDWFPTYGSIRNGCAFNNSPLGGHPDDAVWDVGFYPLMAYSILRFTTEVDQSIPYVVTNPKNGEHYWGLRVIEKTWNKSTWQLEFGTDGEFRQQLILWGFYGNRDKRERCFTFPPGDQRYQVPFDRFEKGHVCLLNKLEKVFPIFEKWDDFYVRRRQLDDGSGKDTKRGASTGSEVPIDASLSA